MTTALLVLGVVLVLVGLRQKQGQGSARKPSRLLQVAGKWARRNWSGLLVGLLLGLALGSLTT